MLAVLQGDVDFVISTMNDTAMQSVRTQKMKLLGVTTKEPFPLMPDVPPHRRRLPRLRGRHLGRAGGPSRHAPEVIATLNRAFTEALSDPETRGTRFHCRLQHPGRGERED